MRLTHRGGHYDDTSPVLEVTEGEILSGYRGGHSRTIAEFPVPQPNPRLHDHGALYVEPLRSVGSVQTAAANELPLVNILNAAPNFKKELAAIHRQNLTRNLERRLQAAQERGDRALINLLEAERQQLV